jgi:hypothetical protein
MKLALRRDAPSGANWMQRFFCWVIRARLVSMYCHGGIVIAGRLYHSTASKGLHCLPPNDWNPEKWDIFEVGGDDTKALDLFAQYMGAKYDWLGLLTFVGTKSQDSAKMYCFEWCYYAMTGKKPFERITPELLLINKPG